MNLQAVQEMQKSGADNFGQNSKVIKEELKSAADAMITLCGRADENSSVDSDHKVKLHLPFGDPAAGSGAEAL